MHLFKTLQNFLFDKEYFLSMWENYIHVYGFLSVEELRTACKYLFEKYPDDYATETNSKRCILCLDFKENYQ